MRGLPGAADLARVAVLANDSLCNGAKERHESAGKTKHDDDEKQGDADLPPREAIAQLGRQNSDYNGADHRPEYGGTTAHGSKNHQVARKGEACKIGGYEVLLRSIKSSRNPGETGR